MEAAIFLNMATLKHRTKASTCLSSLWSLVQDQHWDSSLLAVGTKELSQVVRGRHQMEIL